MSRIATSPRRSASSSSPIRPGHEQYTRNMATGASTANLAIILVDARKGVLPQSRRHAFIAALLGIPHLVVAVNKMDLVDFSEDVFNADPRGVHATSPRDLQLADIYFIPISALRRRQRRRRRAANCRGIDGASLLDHLETVPIAATATSTDMRFPVQYVIRPNLDFRGFAGQVASGVIRRAIASWCCRRAAPAG